MENNDAQKSEEHTSLSHRWILAGVIILLGIAPFFHGVHPVLPKVKGGDEPHYLVQISSLLADRDLDLRNDYDAARRGGLQAGWNFQKAALDHHTFWMKDGERIYWYQIYTNPTTWPRGNDGILIPQTITGKTDEYLDRPEHSVHPPGIAFLLAPLLWPLVGTRWLEVVAVLCSTAAVCGGALIFFRLARRYTMNPTTAAVATALAFLGTPLWAYSRTLFIEPFFVFFALAACVWVLEREEGWVPGLFVGIGVFLKPNFVVLALPFAAYLLYKKKWGSVLTFCAGPVVAVSCLLWMNSVLFGSPWVQVPPYEPGNPLKTLPGILFSWNHGLLAFSPIVFLSFWNWRRFRRENKEEAFLLGSLFLAYMGVISSIGNWDGGWSYGPRYLVPVIPFLMVPLVYVPVDWKFLTPGHKRFVLFLCVLSVLMNALGAAGKYWSLNPLDVFTGDWGG